MTLKNQFNNPNAIIQDLKKRVYFSGAKLKTKDCEFLLVAKAAITFAYIQPLITKTNR